MKVRWAAVGRARAQPPSATADLNKNARSRVTCGESSSRPWPSPRPAPSYQVRSCAGVQTWQLEMVWGAPTMLQGMEGRHMQVGLWLEHRCASCCWCCNCRWDHCTNLHCNIFFGGLGAVIVPSSQWQADRSHSGIPVTLSFNSTLRCFEHFDLLGINFLACCVSIWK